MLFVRFRQTFRERLPEWIMAFVTEGWGLNALFDSFTQSSRHTFDSPFYGPLLAIMDQHDWGLYASGIGAVRLTCLWINGSRPRGSATVRAFGAWLSTIFWMGLFVGALELPWHSGACFTYGGLLAFDVFGLWFAASDARSAFVRSRGAPSYGGI